MSISPSSGTATPTTPSTESTSTLALIKAGVSAIISDPATGALPQSQSLPQEGADLPNIDASKLTITYTSNPKPTVKPNDPNIPSQSLTTDHMLQIPWSTISGWSSPTIVPYGPLNLDPAASCLHYATECFEGMKLYRSPHDGKLRMFRPQLNAQRFLKSATRIALPSFSPSEFLKCLDHFVELEGEKWLPDTPEWRGRCLYLRPTMIGTGNRVGVQRPEQALLYVIALYVPDMTSSTGLKLLASKHNTIRAWPGGFGFAKVGANYGPTLVAQGEAKSRGYSQVLWLFGDEGYVTEAGAANFFVLWEMDDGGLELVTPPLGQGIILPGVTRGSVLELVRSESVKGPNGSEVTVSERNVRMSDIVQANKEGRLVEAFACGTAFFVFGVSEIDFRGETVMLPLAEGKESKFTAAVKSSLEDIMYGKVQHEWGYLVGQSH